MAEYFKRVVQGAFLIFIFNIFAAFFSYLMRFVMTSNLTPQDYALFYSCFSLVGLVMIFSDLGLTHSMIYHISRYRAQGKYDLLKNSILTGFLMQLLLGIVFASIIFFSSKYIATYYLHLSYVSTGYESAVLILQLLALGVFLNVFLNIVTAIFQGFQQMKIVAIGELSRMFMWFAFTTGLVFMGFSVISPALGFVLAYVTMSVIFGFVAIRLIPKSKTISRPDNEMAKKLFGYGLPVMISLAVGYVLSYTDTIMLTLLTGLGQIHLYQTAQPTATLLWFFSGSLVVVLFPLITEIHAKTPEKVGKNMGLIYKYIWLVVIPAALIMFSFSAEILGVLFGPNYVGGSNVLKILSVGAIFFSVTQINGTFLNGIGKPDSYKNVVYKGAAFNVVGNFVLIPILGMEGAAFSTLLAYLYMFFGTFIEMRKLTRPSIPYGAWAKTIFSGLIALAALYVTKTLVVASVFVEIALGLAVFGVVFGVFVLMFRVITVGEITKILKKGLSR